MWSRCDVAPAQYEHLPTSFQPDSFGSASLVIAVGELLTKSDGGTAHRWGPGFA